MNLDQPDWAGSDPNGGYAGHNDQLTAPLSERSKSRDRKRKKAASKNLWPEEAKDPE